MTINQHSSTTSAEEMTWLLTMKETDNVRDGLLRMKDGLLNRLVSLASDRRQAEGLVSDFQRLERAIAALEPGNMKYARHKSVVLAIVDYLDEVGRAVPAEEIVSALAAGGFRGGGEAAKPNIRRSLSSFSTGEVGRRLKQIREVDGLVGKSDWPDDLFAAK